MLAADDKATCSISTDSPVISGTLSWLLCAFFTLSYVGSLYLARAGRLAFHAPPVDVPNGQERVRLANEKWRNDPQVIKARLKAVAVSTLGSCAVVVCVVSKFGSGCRTDDRSSFSEALSVLGLSLPSVNLNLWSILRPHLLAPVLYVGPLYIMLLDTTLPFQRDWDFKRDVVEKFTSWQGLRNYSIAPATEELVFRSCIISMMKLSGATTKQMVFAGPLWFGVAHAHHAWELYNIYGRTKSALQRAVLTCAFQLTYTTLFGWFTTFIFLRTGSVYPAITSHTFCNIMGLPDPGYGARMFPRQAAVIYALHVVGMVAFGFALGPWTK
ncbi:hypothetical protein M407DRAFT_19565 [Tulasnella calospora MUT 4182]|uniref:intramembrane prenyl-peptidase Rce1 n=1 Tax=Tulasnella calospora MUT 4182 TaxID=1051891 RepID=A0A0C3QHQ6_9AGAM|nr:hypothetical protein M407DRAFT_19565 [Tulasnella calospora MUT 4182]